MKPIINLKNVSKIYHNLESETLALKNINFCIYPKEFLSIVGPSGCGKSTILSLISGLCKASKGEILINKEYQKNNNLFGYMLQSDYLFSWRTIYKNIILSLEIKNSIDDISKKYVLELLKKYELEKFKDYYPNQLSGGMRQKAALIRTLVLKPEILLLDEPFSALDYQTRLRFSNEVKNIIKKEKKTAVLVTHDISEAINLSDRILILSKQPSKIKKTIKIEDKFANLSYKEKLKHRKFNEYFEIIWSEFE